MEKLVDWKFKIPVALKGSIFKIAKRLSVPAASAVRIAITEFVERREQAKAAGKTAA